MLFKVFGMHTDLFIALFLITVIYPTVFETK